LGAALTSGHVACCKIEIGLEIFARNSNFNFQLTRPTATSFWWPARGKGIAIGEIAREIVSSRLSNTHSNSKKLQTLTRSRSRSCRCSFRCRVNSDVDADVDVDADADADALAAPLQCLQNFHCHFPASLNYRPFVSIRLSTGKVCRPTLSCPYWP